ncbi:MAG: PTS sugar transporter subunit IIC [Clostridium sp.]|nr:PTS sugar transporter subunit IIC [Bacteroides sp.]MCM1199344.1 PTS sugar transporter subunit IIC [Clostridium sp.]
MERFFRKYIVDALGHMAMGLFCSLILGLIIGQIAKIPGMDFLVFIAEALSASSPLVGACIGLAIALGMKCAPLVVISSAITGALGYQFGGPVGAYLAVIIGAELGERVSKKTPVDIIVTPLVTIVAGGLFAKWCCSPINDMMLSLGALINRATMLSPFMMGLTVSVLVGCALTLPISSVAICVMLGLDGLAAGAATAGCCAQMIGFAVISYSDNGVGGLLSQGLGTSMLQIGNIARKPIIWLAPTLTSAILGPVSTVWLQMTNNALGAGMGTAGLVGPLATYATMTEAGAAAGPLVMKILCLHFIAPAIISLCIHLIMKRLGWVAAGDMKI